MAVNFDKWTVLKLLEMLMAAVCLGFKKATDDEARRLFLYLEKLSREWSLLNNVTWDRVGAAVADATYGGYVIITAALFVGRLFGEYPTHRRISEFVLLGLGALLFLVLGSLEFAALDSVPPNLVDNAAILGSLTLFTAALFLLDIGGPRARRPATTTNNGFLHNNYQHQQPRTPYTQTEFTNKAAQAMYDVEKDLEHQSNGKAANKEVPKVEVKKSTVHQPIQSNSKPQADNGRDTVDDPNAEEVEEHSPVWSKIRKGQYGKYDIVSTSLFYPTRGIHERHPPRNPSEPGYVQYTAQHWGENIKKSPGHSPTPV